MLHQIPCFLSFQEAEVVTSMSFHPTGDFILVGTEHPTSELLHDNLSVRPNGLSCREVK